MHRDDGCLYARGTIYCWTIIAPGVVLYQHNIVLLPPSKIVIEHYTCVGVGVGVRACVRVCVNMHMYVCLYIYMINTVFSVGGYSGQETGTRRV